VGGMAGDPPARCDQRPETRTVPPLPQEDSETTATTANTPAPSRPGRPSDTPCLAARERKHDPSSRRDGPRWRSVCADRPCSRVASTAGPDNSPFAAGNPARLPRMLEPAPAHHLRTVGWVVAVVGAPGCGGGDGAPCGQGHAWDPRRVSFRGEQRRRNDGRCRCGQRPASTRADPGVGAAARRFLRGAGHGQYGRRADRLWLCDCGVVQGGRAGCMGAGAARYPAKLRAGSLSGRAAVGRRWVRRARGALTVAKAGNLRHGRGGRRV
jgi:hypothetical protein